jgi:hypothetical protein
MCWLRRGWRNLAEHVILGEAYDRIRAHNEGEKQP